MFAGQSSAGYGDMSTTLVSVADVPDVARRARKVPCPICSTATGQACMLSWDHLARYRQAYRRRLVTETELDQAHGRATAHGDLRVVGIPVGS